MPVPKKFTRTVRNNIWINLNQMIKTLKTVYLNFVKNQPHRYIEFTDRFIDVLADMLLSLGYSEYDCENLYLIEVPRSLDISVIDNYMKKAISEFYYIIHKQQNLNKDQGGVKINELLGKSC